MSPDLINSSTSSMRICYHPISFLKVETYLLSVVEIKLLLTKAELKFLRDLKKGSIYDYDKIYLRTIKNRILMKYRKLTHEALLINEVLDRLKSL